MEKGGMGLGSGDSQGELIAGLLVFCIRVILSGLGFAYSMRCGGNVLGS